MPALSSHRGGRRRRTMNEINMVPFIDVMLVLLIIFMVSAPLITTGVVDLPSVGKARAQPPRVIEVVVRDEQRLALRIDGEEVGEVLLRETRKDLRDLAQRVRAAQNDAPGGDAAQVPVIISARKDVRYETVVNLMDALQREQVPRVGLAVTTTGER